MPKSIKITLRLGQRDGDLRLLAQNGAFHDIIVQAIKLHLGLTKTRIKLPPLQPLNNDEEDMFYCFYIGAIKNPDVFAFLSNIPSGSRSTALKLLIRHAMVSCDLRHLQIAPSNIPTPRKATAKSKATVATRSPAPSKPPTITSPVAPIAPPRYTQPNSDEDDIFAGI